jgi:hypothetical protein
VHETQVTLEFRPKGASKDVTLIHERFRGEELRKQDTEGWIGCLSRLARKISS